MGVFYEEIPKSLMEWIMEQKCFWVATAPLKGGHVNVCKSTHGIVYDRTSGAERNAVYLPVD